MGSGNFIVNKHSVGINAFHLEWCTKYRFPILQRTWINKILKESIANTCQQYSIQLLAMEIGADHIHLFVNLPSKMAVATALQLFKGRSARELFSLCEYMKMCYHKGHLWSRGVFYRSVSNVSADTVYKYISEHKSKELQNTVSSVRKEVQQLTLLSFS